MYFESSEFWKTSKTQIDHCSKRRDTLESFSLIGSKSKGSKGKSATVFGRTDMEWFSSDLENRSHIGATVDVLNAYYVIIQEHTIDIRCVKNLMLPTLALHE